MPVLIKPDAVRAGHSPRILATIEQAGFSIVATARVRLLIADIQQMYAHHADEPFFAEACRHLASEDSLAVVVSGDIEFDGLAALKQLIRARFATSLLENAVHMPRSEAERVRDLQLLLKYSVDSLASLTSAVQLTRRTCGDALAATPPPAPTSTPVTCAQRDLAARTASSTGAAEYLVCCIGTNEILHVVEPGPQVVRRIGVPVVNEFDALHTLRRYGEGYLASTRSGLVELATDLSVVTSWSDSSFCNIHAAEPLPMQRVAVCNTGYDEILLCRLLEGRIVHIENSLNVAAYCGLDLGVSRRDRRFEPKLSGGVDKTHVNSCTPCTIGGRTCLLLALYHQGSVLVVDATSLKVTIEYPQVGRGVHSPVVTSDGRLIVCSSADSKIIIYDMDTRSVVKSLDAPGPVWTHSPVCASNNDLVFVGEADRASAGRSYLARVNMDTGRIKWMLCLPKERPFDILPC